MVAAALTSSTMADAPGAAPSAYPAAQALEPDGATGRLAPVVGLMVAVTLSLGLWGLLFAAARFVLA